MTLSLNSMRSYLSRSISSLNRNKINGMLAEIDFRNKLNELGFGDRVSQGGWIVRSTIENHFSEHINVFFPRIIQPQINYDAQNLEEPPRRLHTICSTMHQIGIHSYYCVPVINNENESESVSWLATQLGIPNEDDYHEFNDVINGFEERARNYNFLRHHQDVGEIPVEYIPEEFTKENIRVKFQENYFCEISDIDGILWGEQFTYPIEIKEKTVAYAKRLGYYFGLDVGPFVKLAFYAAKKSNLHSIFVVKEIDDIENRNLVNWWFITFDKLAQYASWVFVGGGRNMQGGRSSVVRIPKNEFVELTSDNLTNL